MNQNWNFQEWSGASNPKKPSVGGVWIFSGATWPGFFKRGGGGGGGGHTGSNNIVMVFSPRNIVGCLAYKGGVTGTPGPPSYALAWISYLVFLTLTIFKNEERRKSIAEKSLRKKRSKLEQ